jgi:hypothetical protein
MVLSRGRAWYRGRAQFDKIIRAPSAQGLVQRLRAKQQ